MLTNTKPKTCQQCNTLFAPLRAMAVVCSTMCAIKLGKAKKAAAKVTLKARKEAIKRKGEYVKEAQVVANRYARVRDTLAGRGCISCGARPAEKFGGAMDAGHFRSVGSAPHLRFFLPQIRLQCVKCNRYLGGNAVEYRKGFVALVGAARVEQIEAMQAGPKPTVDYLQKFKRVISKRTRRLEERHG